VNGRRRALQALTVASVALVAGPAFAGSYLTRAALLVLEGRKEADCLRQHFADKELARMIHRMTVTRVEASSKMMVPKEVVQAHPHLLLVFEHYERAADHAENGEAEHFLVACQKAFDEERAFRFVLRQLGWELPSESPRR
jgi:hypothetical protein